MASGEGQSRATRIDGMTIAMFLRLLNTGRFVRPHQLAPIAGGVPAGCSFPKPKGTCAPWVSDGPGRVISRPSAVLPRFDPHFSSTAMVRYGKQAIKRAGGEAGAPGGLRPPWDCDLKSYFGYCQQPRPASSVAGRPSPTRGAPIDWNAICARVRLRTSMGATHRACRKAGHCRRWWPRHLDPLDKELERRANALRATPMTS